MQTWEKFLPDYEIVLLNYDNYHQWLGTSCYSKTLFTDFSLPKQADAIRCAVLRRWGGIWFDTDTILTSFSTQKIMFESNTAELSLFNRHLAVIFAQKGAKILYVWEVLIKLFIFLHSYKDSLWMRSLKLSSHVNRWDYLGNNALRFPLYVAFHPYFKSLDKFELKTFPEQTKNMPSLDYFQAYRNFYFSPCASVTDAGFIEKMEKVGSLICLHNSWTPPQYLSMDEETFLQQDIFLAKLLQHALNKTIV